MAPKSEPTPELIPRRNPDGSLYTWIVKGKSNGEDVVVDDRTFDPKHHTESAEQKKAHARGPSAATDRATRETELQAMTVAELKPIAEELELDWSNKADSITAILDAEFPED